MTAPTAPSSLSIAAAADTLMLGLAAMTGMVSDMTANRDVLRAAAALTAPFTRGRPGRRSCGKFRLPLRL